MGGYGALPLCPLPYATQSKSVLAGQGVGEGRSSDDLVAHHCSVPSTTAALCSFGTKGTRNCSVLSGV